MKFQIAVLAVLLAVASQRHLVDARATRSLVDDIEDGFDDFEDDVDEWADELFGDDCSCPTSWFSRNHCAGNSGTTTIGCTKSNQFIQCLNESCSVQTCPTGALWNSTSNVCSPCPSGQHVDADNQTCACNNGTRIERGRDGERSWRAKTCVQCPTNATQDVDTCYCQLPLIEDKLSNSCRACPTGASLGEDKSYCQCNNGSLIWSANLWECVACPGVWRSAFDIPFLPKECVCTNNTVFIRRNASCFACPSPAQAFGGVCVCPLEHQWFDWKTLACVCARGRAMNENQTACERVRSTTAASSVASTATGTTAASTSVGSSVQSTSTGSSVQSTATGSSAQSTPTGSSVQSTSTGSSVQSTSTGSTVQSTPTGQIVQ